MANRNQYTYTPGYTGGARAPKPQPAASRAPAPRAANGARPSAPPPQARYGGGPPGNRPPAQQQAGRPTKDLMMFAMILFIIPLTGIIAVIYQPFLWVFVLVTAVCLALLWILRCFAQGTRVIFSGMLAMLTVVALIAAVDLSPKEEVFPDYYSASGAVVGQEPNPAVNMGMPEISATPTAPIDLAALDMTQGTQEQQDALPDVLGDNPVQLAAGATEPPQLGGVPGTETDAPPVNQAVSGAQAALENYLLQWKVRDYEEMVKYAQPTWCAAQKAAQQQLYWNHNWWIINDWTITPETTSPVADSASFTVIANLNKSSSTKESATKKFSALVFNENGTWYVDPDSLRDGVGVAETPPPEEGYSAAQTPQPEPTIDPNMKLWYNSEGGEYYHAEEKCKKINEKYYKSMKSFSYSELATEHSKLLPCASCNAPEKPK